MSNFVALNIEIEEESEDEIDDSKEIQIEEALRLYQNALELHSQGPEFYDEAEKAYNELFQSEIFTWEESLPEAQRIERYDDVDSSDDEIEDVLTPPSAAPATFIDGSPSSLPQILYLAYKNHGQFLLDRLKSQLSCIEAEIWDRNPSIAGNEVNGIASRSLKLLVEALDRDDTDLELWRLVSRIGDSLGSRRIARFCLEAVLDTDESDFNTWTEPVELEGGFAIEQLKPLLSSLNDQLSQSQVLPMLEKRRNIMACFTKYIDLCPYLPTLLPGVNTGSDRPHSSVQTIKVPLRSWASCGRAILLHLGQEASGVIESDPGARYALALPPTRANTMPAPPSKTITGGKLAPTSPPAFVDNYGEGEPEIATKSDEATATILLAEPIEISPVNAKQHMGEHALGSPTMTDDIGGRENGITVGGDGSPTQADVAQNTAGSTVSVSLPTRKRSSETAELPDSTDVGRSRSKRIKARESLDPGSLKDSTAEDWAKWYEQQLQIYHRADGSVFDMVETIQSKLGSQTSISLGTLREIVSKQNWSNERDGTKAPLTSLDLVAQNLKSTLDGWDIGRSKAFLNGHDPNDPAGGCGGSRSPGFSTFLEHSNQEGRILSQKQILPDDHDLDRFVHFIDRQEWITLDQLAYQWLDMLLSFPLLHRLESRSHVLGSFNYEIRTLYESHRWPDSLKESVVRMLVFQDQAVYSETNRLIHNTEQEDQDTKEHTHGQVPLKGLSCDSQETKRLHLHSDVLLPSSDTDEAKRKYTNSVQAIFELHLDVYGRITNPSSKVDEATRTLQRDRLCRWAALASKLINQWSWPGNQVGEWSRSSDDLYIRFLWASVVCNSLLEPSSRDYIVLCYQDLIRLLKEFDSKRPSTEPLVIELPNNAIMPEISIEAAEKEISRLTTIEFFMGIFNSQSNDPLTIIESLEPLLDLSVNHRKSLIEQHPGNHTGDEDVLIASPSSRASDDVFKVDPDPKLLEALHFLERGSLPLRLFLWQKLRDNYRAIAYPPQVLSCDLRMMILIIDHLGSPSHGDTTFEDRRDSLLRWLHRLDDHVTRILSIALSKSAPFECIDGDQICVSLEALTSLQKILHIFALWEDTIRVGQTPPPAQVNQNATRGLAKSTDKFRDMIVKTWTLQYIFLKEAMAQNARIFDSQEQDLVSHLENVHQALGLRCYCSLANKSFLKLMKKELESFKFTGDRDTDMAQLVYDLYGVKTSSNAMEMQDHGCLPESLDRGTALEIMDLVMAQVNRISTKDLLKSDLKFTVDKMQQVIMIPKLTNSATRTFNNRLVNNYFKLPLNPYDLYQSLRGIGGLCGSKALDEGSEIASKGWYALLGQIALAKFRSLKRSSAGSTDDLCIARTFLRHDLEFDTDRWETWYRLGQVYDAFIEEDTTWTADKLDNHMDDLVELQRKAIHCYTMATAVATRCAEGSLEDTSKMADLCADFGTRVYSSTREPFSMRAFSLDDYKRHYNSRTTGMYQDVPFRGMQLYSAWKFASILLRRASVQKPQDWVISFTYGKVMWKMHKCSDEVLETARRIGYRPVIDAFVRAIEACPEKRDSRHPDKDPILEPHYKLVSVVHKLVRSRRILDEEGRRILKATPYARKATEQKSEDWNGYIMQTLKTLRSADKANWHHRMVARAAHIFYDDDPQDPRAASGARNELSQQIFTKTMAIQVWKPDNERPGRHFVYTGRYVRFFTRLLYQLNDKTNLDALARRIRKRAGDFVNHVGVWEEVCRAYLKLLHHQPYCSVTDGYSEFMFQGMDPEMFQLHAARLETYVHSQQTTPPLLDILREAIELKKLNNNLFRPINLFEDLIRDIYAHLYDNIIPGVMKDDATEENRVRMRVDNILTNPTLAAIEAPLPDAQGGEQTKKSGARYVTPREIVRKAEAIVSKPAPTVPTKVLKALAPAPSMELGALPPSDAPRLAVVIHTDGANDGGSSAPGSVHDSADDESELSEADEDPAKGAAPSSEHVKSRLPMFPNLLGSTVDNPEEIDGDTNDERMEGQEVDEEEDQEMDAEMAESPAKESGVHEGNW